MCMYIKENKIKMAKIDDFKKQWKKRNRLSEIVEALDKGENFDDAYSDFLRFWQDERPNVALESMKLAQTDKVAYAKVELSDRNEKAIDYGLKNVGDILEGLGDKLNAVALNAPLPIPDKDHGRIDDLEGLIKDYQKSADTLERNLGKIDRNVDGELYETQSKAAVKYRGLVSLLGDYKDLVKTIEDAHNINSYANGGKDGKPDIRKMQELVFEYLDKVSDSFKGNKDIYEDNVPTIKIVRFLAAKNPEFLKKLYSDNLVAPASKKLETALKGANLKDYLKRNVDLMDRGKQGNFFDIVYAVSEK